MPVVDLNADAGEAHTDEQWRAEERLIPLVTSVNIACAAHAGSLETMRHTARFATRHGIALGAHPGLPDRAGFGRRPLPVTPSELYLLVSEQCGALREVAGAVGQPMRHVKLHGALYHMADRDARLAEATVAAVIALDARLRLFIPAGGELQRAANEKRLRTVCEAFVDRAYEEDGSLTARGQEGAIILDPLVAAARARQMVCARTVTARTGRAISIVAETLCIHGDHPHAEKIAREVRRVLAAHQVSISAPSNPSTDT